MTLRLNGATSGYTEIDAAAVAGSNTVTLPTGTGAMPLIKLETAKSATGTAVDFTGIPSWAKRITVIYSNVSTNGTSNTTLRLGTSAGIVSSGYDGNASSLAASTITTVSFSTGFQDNFAGATTQRGGFLILTTFDANNSIWLCSGTLTNLAGTSSVTLTGRIVLASALTQLRVTTVNGTDTFDTGNVNILYEG